MVFDGDTCFAWCQFGPRHDLPNIYHKREVEARGSMPDWRITCIFVDKDHRKKDLSYVSLNGDLEVIGTLGGGVVESDPQDTLGKRVSNAFLYNGAKRVFERAGLEHVGKKGKNQCIMQLQGMSRGNQGAELRSGPGHAGPFHPNAHDPSGRGPV